MNSPSLPENWRSLLAGYVLNDLTDAEAALVEQWLDLPEVALELDALQSTWASLPAGLSPLAPPPELRDRIMAAVTQPELDPAVTAQSSAVQTVNSSPIPRRGFPWGRLALALGWVATAIALGLARQENQRLRLALRQTEAIVASFSQPTNRLYTLAGTAAVPQANARLVVNPADQTALIVTTDLPTLTTEQVYRLWAVADSDPVFCGQFNPQTVQAMHQWSLPNPTCADRPVQMLITTEKAADPPLPAGDLVMQSQS
ncbi:anti-sigma factor [Nodosilinea sp. E11]|uniref:anti-sigma factor n=1 Tax=Nodosilinea sp. E11 TaxID=3037479 RepID=UPI002934E7D0|nr:anti-sigma factor [Nodosilinea sp. E11]WOD41240.1 anti-sigma factor [Nodosilinea sp. E11]